MQIAKHTKKKNNYTFTALVIKALLETGGSIYLLNDLVVFPNNFTSNV